MKPRYLVLLPLMALLGGCAVGLLAGGAVTGIVAAHDRRTVGTVIDDQVLELDISHAFGADRALIDLSNINVTVYNKTVLLSGETPTDELKARAGEFAKRVAGQDKRVFNELVIRAPSSLWARSQDALVTTKAKAVLLDVLIEGFDPTRVKVVTEAGVVFLMGLVTREEAGAVTAAIQTVGGVGKIVRVFEYIEPDDPRIQYQPGGRP